MNENMRKLNERGERLSKLQDKTVRPRSPDDDDNDDAICGGCFVLSHACLLPWPLPSVADANGSNA